MLGIVIRTGLVALGVALLAAPCAAQQEARATPEGRKGVPSAVDQSISAALAWADAQRAEGNLDAAVETLQKVLSREPSNIDALRLLGDIAWEQQDAEQARKYWLAVREVQPNDFGANWGLGRLNLAGRASARSAIYYLEVAERVVPADEPELKSQLLVALSQAYAANQENRKALETARKVLGSDPDNFDACYLSTALRARIARTDDDYDQALSDAERLVEIVRHDLQTTGATEEGVRRLLTAYQMELEVLKATANVLFERNTDGSLTDRLQSGKEQRAAKTISKTVDIMVRQADVQRTLTYYRIVEMAARAVEYDASPSTLMDLGLLQKAVGKNAEAIQTFSRVLAIDPLHKEARRQLDGLQSQRSAAETWPNPLTP